MQKVILWSDTFNFPMVTLELPIHNIAIAYGSDYLWKGLVIINGIGHYAYAHTLNNGFWYVETDIDTINAYSGITRESIDMLDAYYESKVQ